MSLSTAISQGKSQLRHLEEYTKNTGVLTHLLQDENTLPQCSKEAEKEITNRLVTQIGNASSPKEEASRLIIKDTSKKQRSYLRRLISESLDKALAPVFTVLKEKTGIDGEMVKKGISRGVKRLNLMLSNASSKDKKEAFKGDPMGRILDVFFPKDKDKAFLAGCFVAWSEYCEEVKNNLPRFEKYMQEKLNELIGVEKTNKIINTTKDILSKDKTSLAFLGTGVGLTASATLPALLALPTAFLSYLLPIGIISLEVINQGMKWKDKHNIKPDLNPYNLLQEEAGPEIA